jgi:hypothetical protein
MLINLNLLVDFRMLHIESRQLLVLGEVVASILPLAHNRHAESTSICIDDQRERKRGCQLLISHIPWQQNFTLSLTLSTKAAERLLNFPAHYPRKNDALSELLHLTWDSSQLRTRMARIDGLSFIDPKQKVILKPSRRLAKTQYRAMIQTRSSVLSAV